MVRLTRMLRFRFEAPRQGSPMVYPSTHAAQVSQFDVKYWWKHNDYFRWWSRSAFFVVLPIVTYIHFLVNSPQAKAAWAAKCKQDEHKEHLAKMWKDIEGIYANR